MIKKFNTPQFFCLCFIAAFMAEVYCFTVLEGDPISVIGIGLVVLITGYLLLDSLAGSLSQGRDKMKADMEAMYREESENWKERYTELMNIQKATYAALKKTTARMEEQIKELQGKLEDMEEANSKSNPKSY